MAHCLKSHGIPQQFAIHSLFHANVHVFVYASCILAKRKANEEKKMYIARGKYYDRRHIHAIVTQWICVHLFDIHYGNVNGDVRVVAQQTLDLVNFSLRHKLLFC